MNTFCYERGVFLRKPLTLFEIIHFKFTGKIILEDEESCEKFKKI